MSTTEVINPIITIHGIFDSLEKDAHDLVEGAGKDSKTREDLWKIANAKKAEEQQQLAKIYTTLAIIGGATTVVSGLCGGLSAAHAINPAKISAGVAKMSDTIGLVSKNASEQVISQVGQSFTTKNSIAVDAYYNTSQALWAQKQTDTDSRKEQLQNVKRGVGDASAASVSKLSECMTTR